VQYRHYDKAIASFADGHVSPVNKTDAKLPWDLPVKMVVEKPVVKPAVKKKSKRNK
jgi:prepilin-type processing-associated H-X9-DG protein